MKHTRLILTEAGACVSVTHLVQGVTKDAVIHRATTILRATIDNVVRDHPKAAPSPDELEATQQHGVWWVDLGCEEFTVMIAEPEKVEILDNTQIEIDVQGGRVNQVHAPTGTTIVVRDYDTDGVQESLLRRDEAGRRHVQTRWEGGTP